MGTVEGRSARLRGLRGRNVCKSAFAPGNPEVTAMAKAAPLTTSSTAAAADSGRAEAGSRLEARADLDQLGRSLVPQADESASTGFARALPCLPA